MVALSGEHWTVQHYNSKWSTAETVFATERDQNLFHNSQSQRSQRTLVSTQDVSLSLSLCPPLRQSTPHIGWHCLTTHCNLTASHHALHGKARRQTPNTSRPEPRRHSMWCSSIRVTQYWMTLKFYSTARQTSHTMWADVSWPPHRWPTPQPLTLLITNSLSKLNAF